jgi:hypothetical protein
MQPLPNLSQKLPSENGADPYLHAEVPEPATFDPAMRFVEQRLSELGCHVTADGYVQAANLPTEVTTAAEVLQLVTLRQRDETYLLNWIGPSPFRRQEIREALARVKDIRAAQRKAAIITSLIAPPAEDCTLAWQSCAGLFNDSADVVIAVLQHFIWQVKCKLTNSPVSHHMMPMIVSPIQGAGKSEFVRHFLGPLHELVGGPYTIEQFADSRSRDIYGYPAVWIDDMGKTAEKLIPALKQIMTAGQIGRRVLGSGKSLQIQQRSTLIGAANHGLAHLVHDTTGNRRFAELHFRNGNVENGGDPAVWQTVRSLPYLAMWQSVSHLKPSPLIAHLGAVTTFQAAAGPIDEVKQWAHNIDFSSTQIERISGPRGIRASSLYERFRDDTQSDLTLKAFSERMAGLASESEFPFDKSLRSSAGVIYPLRRKQS